MTRNEIIDLGVTIALIPVYEVPVFYISANYSGSERWAWLAVLLAVAYVLGRLINYVLKRFGLRD